MVGNGLLIFSNKVLNMKKIIFFIVCMQLFGLVYAQQKLITGKVITGDDNEPIPGVNVVIKGTQKGTITDLDGKFSIKASEQDILTFF